MAGRVLGNFAGTQRFSCFRRPDGNAEKVLNSGAYAAFGFSIFQNRDGAEILKTIPAERMLFETDSPYMAEIRGEENQPRLLPKIALKIAEIRGDDPERLAAQVYENSLKIAGLK